MKTPNATSIGNIRLLLSVAYGLGVRGPDRTGFLEEGEVLFFSPSPPSPSSSSSSSSSRFSRPGCGCSFGTSMKLEHNAKGKNDSKFHLWQETEHRKQKESKCNPRNPQGPSYLQACPSSHIGHISWGCHSNPADIRDTETFEFIGVVTVDEYMQTHGWICQKTCKSELE